ncbi:MAG: pre-peptidase C-terminal domain-containing protein [Nitrospirota bacterium]
MDFYTFTAAANDKVTIRLIRTSGAFQPKLELLDSTGATIASSYNYSGNDVIIDKTLLVGGTYLLIVSDYGDDAAGDYKLMWQKLNNPCNATVINCGQTISSSLSAVGEQDFYSFTASAGDVITIRIVRTSGGMNPYVELYDSAGTRIAYANAYSSSYINLDKSLSADGVYTVIVSDYDNDAVGNYKIFWQKLNDPCNATSITCGQTISSSLDAAGEQDVFFFSATEGSNLKLILTRLSGNLDPSLELYDSLGSRIAYQYTTGSSIQLNKTLPSTGQYVIFASDYGNDETGTYDLKFQKDNDSCTEVIINAPNGGEVIDAGSTYNITWTLKSLVGISSQEIRLSTDGGVTFSTVIASGLAGSVQSFNWSIPTNIKTMQARIRITVTDTSGVSVYDDSDDDFIILQNVPKVTRTYEYDKLNRLVKIINEDGSIITYTYDAVGNRITLTESFAGFSASGRVTTSTGTGISGVTMTFRWISGSAPDYLAFTEPASTQTDVNGNWDTSGFLPGKTYRVTPSKTGYTFSPTYRDFSSSNTGIDFTAMSQSQNDTNPPTGSIIINGGAEATKSKSVILTLTASDDSGGTIQMCISNSNSCSSWTTFASTKSWSLSYKSGTKTVYAWFKDKWGNKNSIPYSDTIILDTTPPTNGTVTATPRNTQVTLNWRGFSDAHSGIASYKVVYSTSSTPFSCSYGSQIYNGSDTTYTHTGLTNGKNYYYRVCAIDKTGNMSSGATISARPHL